MIGVAGGVKVIKSVMVAEIERPSTVVSSSDCCKRLFAVVGLHWTPQHSPLLWFLVDCHPPPVRLKKINKELIRKNTISKTKENSFFKLWIIAMIC